MKRYRPLVFFGLALVLGLVTSVLVFSWLQNEKNRLMAAPIPLNQESCRCWWPMRILPGGPS